MKEMRARRTRGASESSHESPDGSMRDAGRGVQVRRVSVHHDLLPASEHRSSDVARIEITLVRFKIFPLNHRARRV